MNYKEYLKSEEWKQLRKKAYTRSKGFCELCGKKAENIHHICYPKHYSNDSLNNLLAVCERCHKLLHGIRESVRKELLRYSMSQGILLDKFMLDLFSNSTKEYLVAKIKRFKEKYPDDRVFTWHHLFTQKQPSRMWFPDSK